MLLHQILKEEGVVADAIAAQLQEDVIADQPGAGGLALGWKLVLGRGEIEKKAQELRRKGNTRRRYSFEGCCLEDRIPSVEAYYRRE